jgi:drug/metabolite transporter (DMT)-like permease
MVCWHLVTMVGESRGHHVSRLAEVLAVHLGGVIAAAALLAAASVAATGALARRLPVPRRLPLVVAWTGTIASVALAVTALTLITASLLAGNWALSLLVGAVTIASHTRLATSARACRACARITLVPSS